MAPVSLAEKPIREDTHEMAFAVVGQTVRAADWDERGWADRRAGRDEPGGEPERREVGEGTPAPSPGASPATTVSSAAAASTSGLT